MRFPSCEAYVYPGEADMAVYLPLSPERAEELAALLPSPRPTLVALHELDWNGALSPWAAERVFRDGGDFSGGGPAFLRELTEVIIPAMEGEVPARRMIAGYSMGGLFALYAALNTDAFELAASVSGSLWFDGFAAYALQRPCRAKAVYLSLGDKEKNTRNPRMAVIEDCTRAIAAHLGCRVEMNPGGHFREELPRLARGITALMNKTGSAS
ncbi:MAG: hypothetical protein E7316_07460 [Clostridiales bacterium]|nr:hypothetical protein [Clostridiales bacterium]